MWKSILLPVLLLAALAACDREDAGSGKKPEREAVKAEDVSAYVEKGDLEALKKRDRFRILVHRSADDYLPRDGYPFDIQRRMAGKFANEQGMQPVLVAVDDYGQLIPELLAGNGDVIAANLTVTEKRKERVDFTVGVDKTREVVVGRSKGPAVSGIGGLAGHSVGVMKGTVFWQIAQEKLAGNEKIEIVPLEPTLTSDEVLDGLVAGDYDFAIQDSNVMEVVKTYRDDVKTRFVLGEQRPLAWAVRPDNPELRKALDRFLTRERLTRSEIPRHTEDLAGIKKRRTLRVITRNNAATYYLYRGKLVGFEYELARRFAERIGVRLQMVVADSHADMIPMLKEGRGDMIAAFFTITPDRDERGIDFSRPYHYAVETVVGDDDDEELDSPQDLTGRTLHLREASSYWRTAQALRDRGIDVTLEAVPSDMETEEIITRVGDGEFDLTIADSHILQSEQTSRGDIRGLIELGDEIAHGWAVREGNPNLLAEINRFWKKEYRGLHYNIFYKRYFENEKRIREHREGRVRKMQDGRLSQWDHLAKKYGERYGFDWRLLLSQMYQESEFDPEAESWVGAKGLMQVMPKTGKELGLSPLSDPEVSVHAGAKYMDWVRDRFPADLPVDERVWFSLAGYNVGVGHVRDARSLARRQGWDPDTWFGSVENAMLLLSNPKYHRHARFGYARGREPVNYVRHIRDRYRAYVSLTEE